MAGGEAQRNFGLHIGEFFLDELLRGQRFAKDFTVHDILAGAVPAIFGCAHDAPSDSVTRGVEAEHWGLEREGFGQAIFFGHVDLIHGDAAGGSGA